MRRLAAVWSLAAAAMAPVLPQGPLWAQVSPGTGAASASPDGSSEQPISAAIDVTPGATCLQEGPLQTEVQTWLGRDRLRDDVDVHVSGDEHDPRSVLFRIVRQGRTRERRFARLPPDCEGATAVVALAIALAIDATVVPELAAGGGQGDERDAAAARPRRLVAVQAAGGFEVLPGGSLGLTAGIEYGVADWLSLRADVLGLYSWSNAIDGANGVFDAAVGAVLPEICAGGAATPRFRVELCSGAAVGAVHVRGRGYTVSQSSTGIWVVASGGLRLVFDAGVRWAMDVDGIFPLHAPAFRAQDGVGHDVYRAPASAGALLSFGPAFTF